MSRSKEIRRLPDTVTIVNEKKSQVDMEIGSVLTRAELNKQYGGGIQGGMLTPAGGQLMFLFSDPAAGEQYGYKYDGWVTESETVFDYTGEGAENDQQMIRRNETLRRSLNEDRGVHLFLAEGYISGTQTRTHRYVGQFETDPETGWRYEPASDRYGNPRNVIVFTLTRVGAAPAADPNADQHMAGRITGPLTVTEVPAEQTRAEIVHRAETAAMETTRTERQLEDRLREALYVDLRLAIQPAGSSTTLYTDVWDPEERELFEVKSSASRQSIRMAVGQLLDYRRYITGNEPTCVVVVPEDPGEDLRQFVLGVGMDLMFWDEEKHLMRVSSNEVTLPRP